MPSMATLHDKEFGQITIRRSRWARMVSLKVDMSGKIRISMPMRAPLYSAKHLLEDARGRLRQLLGSMAPKNTKRDEAKRMQLRKQAKVYLPKRLQQLAMEGGFIYQKVRLSSAGTRWGSCSSRGTISLNIWLMDLPRDLSDYVIIHELCHTKQMNHSPRFWKLVAVHCPHYKELRQQLKMYHPQVT